MIVLTGALGDIVRATTIIPSLRTALPHGKICWVVEEGWSPVLRRIPEIDTLILVKKKDGTRSYLKCLKEMRDWRADIVLDAQRVAFPRCASRECNWIFANQYLPSAPLWSKWKIFWYQDFLQTLGITPEKDLSLPIQLPTALSSNAQQTLNGIKEYILFVLGSSWPSKRWHDEGHITVAKELIKHSKLPIVLVGAKDEATAAIKIQDSIIQAGGTALSMIGKTTLDDLFYLIKHAHCMLGVDSGPAHIAGLLRTPCVTLLGPTPAAYIGPFGEKNITLSEHQPCSYCFQRICPLQHHKCMIDITPTRVFKALLPMLQ
jgi:ADP-heptose:LPS heptosyltransferase